MITPSPGHVDSSVGSNATTPEINSAPMISALIEPATDHATYANPLGLFAHVVFTELNKAALSSPASTGTSPAELPALPAVLWDQIGRDLNMAALLNVRSTCRHMRKAMHVTTQLSSYPLVNRIQCPVEALEQAVSAFPTATKVSIKGPWSPEKLRPLKELRSSFELDLKLGGMSTENTVTEQEPESNASDDLLNSLKKLIFSDRLSPSKKGTHSEPIRFSTRLKMAINQIKAALNRTLGQGKVGLGGTTMDYRRAEIVSQLGDENILRPIDEWTELKSLAWHNKAIPDNLVSMLESTKLDQLTKLELVNCENPSQAIIELTNRIAEHRRKSATNKAGINELILKNCYISEDACQSIPTLLGQCKSLDVSNTNIRISNLLGRLGHRVEQIKVLTPNDTWSLADLMREPLSSTTFKGLKRLDLSNCSTDPFTLGFTVSLARKVPALETLYVRPIQMKSPGFNQFLNHCARLYARTPNIVVLQ